jgi:hypothetical protein
MEDRLTLVLEKLNLQVLFQKGWLIVLLLKYYTAELIRTITATYVDTDHDLGHTSG